MQGQAATLKTWHLGDLCPAQWPVIGIGMEAAKGLECLYSLEEGTGVGEVLQRFRCPFISADVEK